MLQYRVSLYNKKHRSVAVITESSGVIGLQGAVLDGISCIRQMVTHLICFCRKADMKRGENPILGKHVFVELRCVNHFLMIFVLTP